MDYYKDKTILVTGGAGSIGSEIVRKLSTLEPSVIRAFDNDETALFNLSSQVDGKQLIVRPLYGDIGDQYFKISTFLCNRFGNFN